MTRMNSYENSDRRNNMNWNHYMIILIHCPKSMWHYTYFDNVFLSIVFNIYVGIPPMNIFNHYWISFMNILNRIPKLS